MQTNRTINETMSIFGINAKVAINVMPIDNTNPYIPKLNSEYQFDKELLRDALYILNNDDQDLGLWLAGPRGCGKTTAITQIANRMNYPIISFMGHERREVEDFTGMNKLVNGNFEFVDGPLVKAMENGYIFLLDEADQCPPSVTVFLNGVLEGHPLVLDADNSRVVIPHPDFRFVATGNSNGQGDMSGNYGGVQVMNAAYMDRFLVLDLDYASAKQELSILKNAVPELTEDMLDRMVDYANSVRGLFKGKFRKTSKYPEMSSFDAKGQVTVTMSTRGLLHWAKMVIKFRNAPNPMLYGLERILLNKCEPSERIALQQLAKAMLEGAKK